MKKIKVYFNPRCSKCRIAKDFLDKKNKEYDLYEYLKGDLTVKKLRDILRKGNLNVWDIIRKNEDEYSHFIKGRNLSDDEILMLIVKHPKLLQRPIIVSDDFAIIARDKESLNKLGNL